MVKGEDGLYHIFYSRWPKDIGWSWVTDSEIAHAVSVSPYGPWKFRKWFSTDGGNSTGTDGVLIILQFISLATNIICIIWVIRVTDR